jgi:hypothetical protein
VEDIADFFNPGLPVSDGLERFLDDEKSEERVHFFITAEQRTEDSDPEGDGGQVGSVPELPLDIMKRGKSWIQIPWIDITLTLPSLCRIQGSKCAGPLQGCKV